MNDVLIDLGDVSEKTMGAQNLCYFEVDLAPNDTRAAIPPEEPCGP